MFLLVCEGDGDVIILLIMKVCLDLNIINSSILYFIFFSDIGCRLYFSFKIIKM